ncbi:MAG: DUF4365 domain-containing protein [Deltaproteobacteria bacterium]|nr:DUF4365 domain-containing protein [Deltaproteobacteria bacterium]MBW1792980.1 DUF4365 domain-containing protein [Deltaproteobacteria bacterium]MBW2329474.1 DUF4365 domain-containing protein [Deltaproteobacteria bacterium]
MKAKRSDRVARQGVGIAMSAFEKVNFAFREQHESDYGLDAHVELIENEKPTGQLIGVQLKTGQSYLVERTQSGFVFRSDREHVEYWLNHSLPIVVALCDPDQSIVYWRNVSNESAEETGKGFKIIVPFDQRIDHSSADKLKSLISPIIPLNLYTVFRTDDVSHNLAKRYSIDIVLSGLRTKADISAAIRQATTESVKRKYYRNHIVEGRWGDADADVVWIYVYLSPDDRAMSNWICRSIWIREDLPEDSRPLDFEGENIGGLITVDWSLHYKELGQIAIDNKLRKTDYLQVVLPLIDELENLIQTFKSDLDNLSNSQVSEDEFVSNTVHIRNRIHEIYMLATDMAFPPFECTDMDSKFQEFIALADNMTLYYSENSLANQDENLRIGQVLHYYSLADAELNNLRYEISKVR